MRIAVLLAAIVLVAGVSPAAGDAAARTPDAGRGWLGVYTETPSDAVRAALGIDAGVIVADVVDSSPAAAAGLRKGDVITSLDGVKISDASDLRYAVRERPGKEVSSDVVRQGKKLTLRAKLAAREHDVLWLEHGGWTGIPGSAMRVAAEALQRVGDEDMPENVKAKVLKLDEELEGLDDLREQLEELKDDLQEEIDDLREELQEKLKESGGK